MASARDVAVLMGGWSAEREVSLVSGAECAKALRELGHTVREIDVTRDMDALIAALKPWPDVVFNALHGRYGEDGRIQGLLDLFGLPYTHSGVLASALAMDKPAARQLFASNGLRVPEGIVVRRDDLLEAPEVMERPFVVKPVAEGSSLGVRIVTPGSNALTAANLADLGEDVLVEKFVPGREITVAVMGDRPLAVTELTPTSGFYDYEAKYTADGALHACPAELPAEIYAEALRIASKAHRLLGCRGVSRADLRYDDTAGDSPGGLALLEVNTQPGMTPISLVPEQARYKGMAFAELVGWILEQAQCD